MYSIDSFIHIPIITASVLLAVMFVLLVVIRFRNTAKASFVLYVALGILFTGLIYMLRSSHSVYLVIAMLAAELLVLTYFIILTLGFPLMLEKK